MVQHSAIPVSIRNLSKHYGSVKAVDEVGFDVAPGEFLTLLGPSGSGKTTLLMMIAGFARPTMGHIRLGDADITRLPPHKREIGMVFQNYALFPHMNVGANIAYPLKLRRMGRSEREERVRHALDLVQLAGYEDRGIDQLSGGQRQRIALARAIVFEPRVLLMDEPLSALDKQLRETMQIEIKRLHERLGMTTISVTHDQREALTMSDRIAVFSQGRLEQLATPRELHNKPQNRFCAEFIGETNFVPVEVDARTLSYDGNRLQLAEPEDALLPAPVLMLRPERMIIARPGDGVDRRCYNAFKAKVDDIVFQGDSLLVAVTLSGGDKIDLRIQNRTSERMAPPVSGETVEVLIHRSDTRVVSGEG